MGKVGSAGKVRQNPTIADSLAGPVRQENSASGDEWSTIHQRRKRKGTSPEGEIDVKDSRVIYFLVDPPDKQIYIYIYIFIYLFCLQPWHV